MKKKHNLSALEWEIMEVIWRIGGVPSVRQVLETAYPNGEKAYTTVQTVMNNLENKGFLKKEKIGLVNFYKPLRGKEEIVSKETGNFVHKVFNGSFQALANYIIASDSLSDEEIADLRKMIDDYEKERGKK